MVSEIIHTSIQIAPYVAAGTGIGAVTEHIMVPKVAQGRANLSEVLGVESQGDQARASRVRRTAKRVGSVLAVSGAMTGALIGYGFASEDQGSGPATGAQLVVDRSGATAYGQGETTPLKQIDKVIAKFDENSNFDLTASVAYSGTYDDDMTVDQVKAIRPFGDAPMRAALDDVLGSQNSDSNEDQKDSTVVIATNGNSIGKPEKVINSANEAHKSVYVVNVDPDVDNKTEEGLKQIAEKTRAQYMDASETDLDKVPEIVAAEANPKPEGTDASKAPGVLASMIGLGFFGYMVRMRPRMPFTYKKGEL